MSSGNAGKTLYIILCYRATDKHSISSVHITLTRLYLSIFPQRTKSYGSLSIFFSLLRKQVEDGDAGCLGDLCRPVSNTITFPRDRETFKELRLNAISFKFQGDCFTPPERSRLKDYNLKAQGLSRCG